MSRRITHQSLLSPELATDAIETLPDRRASLVDAIGPGTCRRVVARINPQGR